MSGNWLMENGLSGKVGYRENGPVPKNTFYCKIKVKSDFFFSFFRLRLECPDNYNLSDYVISQISVRPPSVDDSELDEIRVQKLVAKFRESEVCQQLDEELTFVACNKVINRHKSSVQKLKTTMKKLKVRFVFRLSLIPIKKCKYWPKQ